MVKKTIEGDIILSQFKEEATRAEERARAFSSQIGKKDLEIENLKAQLAMKEASPTATNSASFLVTAASTLSPAPQKRPAENQDRKSVV